MNVRSRSWKSISILLIICVTACNTTPPPPRDSGRNTQFYKATKDGFYRVRRGDSLHAIAFDYGLDWRDIARWNRISSPYTIYPDQQLRISPPSTGSAATTAGTGAKQGKPLASSNPKVETRGKPSPGPAKTQDAPVNSTSTERPAINTKSPEPVVTEPLKTPKPSTRAGSAVSSKDPSTWLWPTRGRVVSTFKSGDPARKGVNISGTRGQPVLSSAAGQVVYSGNGLIGYGELIIIKHSERMLSAYAHNSKRLVKEGDTVTAGQHIAAMGTDDRKDVVLHFEIRVNGKPSDPLKFLSAQ
jgi:lipoprotein NlpD